MLPGKWLRCIFLLTFIFSGESDSQIFGRMMYSSDFQSVTHDANSSGLVGVFCVANTNADSNALKAGLDWACGPGGADCSAIQPGQPCYAANNLPELASYAYNDYYHKTQPSGGTCDFSNTAIISNTDPSFGSCVFAGSSGTGGGSGSNSSSGLVPPTSLAPASYDNNSSSGQFLRSIYLTALMILFAWFF